MNTKDGQSIYISSPQSFHLFTELEVKQLVTDVSIREVLIYP